MGFKKRPETTKPRPTRTARSRARKDVEPVDEREDQDEQSASDDAEDSDEDQDDKDLSLDDSDDDSEGDLADQDFGSEDDGERVAPVRGDDEDEFVEEDFGDDDFVDIPEDGDFADDAIAGVGDDEDALVRRPIRGRRATTFNEVSEPEEVDLLSYEEEEELKEDDAEEEESPHAFREKEETFAEVEEDAEAEEEEEEDEPETSTRTDSAQSVSEFLAALPLAQRRLILKLRELIQDTLPGAEESFRIGMLHYSLSGNVAYLDAKRDHVNLGFFRGSELTRIEQARRLLQGTGANLRYIKVFDDDDIRRDLFIKLLREAHTLNKG